MATHTAKSVARDVEVNRLLAYWPIFKARAAMAHVLKAFAEVDIGASWTFFNCVRAFEAELPLQRRFVFLRKAQTNGNYKLRRRFNRSLSCCSARRLLICHYIFLKRMKTFTSY